jgi:hypothetical protein
VRRLAAWEHQNVGSIAGVVTAVETSKDPCDQCGGPMKVQKTIERLVTTLKHGFFQAKETVLVCAGRCVHLSGELVTRRSETLRRLAPAGANYGYDLEVFVGLERFVNYRQREEIRSALKAEHGISLSSGEVSILAARFLSHLEELHLAGTGMIRNVLARDGGYPLHIDATGEDGQGTLFVAYAGWREWVLGAWKIPTERADAMVPHLQDVVDEFGKPCAVVRDLGRAVTGAAAALVSQMDPQPPVLACHLHFLRDVGKDLLNRDYDQLRRLFRNFAVRSKLGSFVRELGRRLGEKVPSLRSSVETWAKQAWREPLPVGPAGLAAVRALGQWVLDYAHDGQHLGFPFDRPYLDLYHRCLTASRAVDAFRHQTPSDRDVLRTLDRLSQLMAPVTAEVAFSRVARKLQTRSKLFDDLRAVLRLDGGKSPSASPNVVSPDEQVESLRKMELCFTNFSRSLRERRVVQGLSKDERQMLDIVLSHLERHGHYLWGHVLRMPEEAGGGIRIVARINNILEGFFHQMKHGERRRSGRKVLTQDFEGLPAAAALARNLTRSDYVELVCGSLEALPERFSALDVARREADLATPKRITATPALPGVVSAALPLSDRRLVRKDSLCERIQAAAEEQALPPLQSHQNEPTLEEGSQPPNEGDKFIVYVPHRRTPTPAVPVGTRSDSDINHPAFGSATPSLRISAC